MAAVPPLVGLALPTGVDGVPAVGHEARDRTLPGTTGSAVAWLTPTGPYSESPPGGVPHADDASVDLAAPLKLPAGQSPGRAGT